MLDKEKEKLFRLVRTKLGGSIRTTELKDEDLCDLLTIAVSDYAEIAQNFIIESNWATLYGKNYGITTSTTDLLYAISLRTLDLARDYADYFSKNVGLQQHGKWELKKDFIKLEKGKQVYVVPAGRHINKVMWVEPPTTDAALFANYGGFGVPFGGGIIGQMGIGAAAAFGGPGTGYGMGAGIWALPAADIATMAIDMDYKRQLLRSDLVYKVTAQADGSHLIHLMSTPGSRLTFGAGGINLFPLHNCYLWYTYYDDGAGDVSECAKENPDVLLSPDQVPLEEMDYALFNAPTKAIIRQLLTGHAAETLGLIRGKFSGQIGKINAPLTLDYNMLLNLGQKERENAVSQLRERLSRMTPYEMMKKQAELVRDMKEAQKGTPLGIYIA